MVRNGLSNPVIDARTNLLTDSSSFVHDVHSHYCNIRFVDGNDQMCVPYWRLDDERPFDPTNGEFQKFGAVEPTALLSPSDLCRFGESS